MKEYIRKEGCRNVMKNNFWMLKQVWKCTPGYVVWMVGRRCVGMNHLGIIYMQQLFDALGEYVPFIRRHGLLRVMRYISYFLSVSSLVLADL
ncbi:MAG: hypothetical protein ACLVAW_18575 [Eisenbergiella massiliensis]